MKADVEEEIRRIFDLQFFGIKLGLVNIRRLLNSLGNPQETFHVILVAGTNGKGSVSSTLASILREAGHTCGLFTSPHLVRFHERFSVNGELIGDDALLAHAGRIWSDLETHRREVDPQGPVPITFFEFATALACLDFRERQCDVAVFECGLGGRLDATNVLSPILDIVTPISFDHTQYLGNTLTAIATEKAGIFREAVPVVMAEQEPEAEEALLSACESIGAPAHLAGRDFDVHRDQRGVVFRDNKGELFPVTTALPGSYQFQNTKVAMAAARLLPERGVAVSDEAILAGPTKVHWPGRLETVAQNPTIILDGAHNPAAASLLVRTLDEQPCQGRTVGVISIMADKDTMGILRAFAPAFDAVVLTAAQMKRAAPPESLAQQLADTTGGKMEIHTAEDFDAALITARKLVGTEGRIVVCGSLFLVGEARSKLLSESGHGKDGTWVGVRG